ncbi:MAG: hypothetical protein CMM48_00660 [Rhodospirillaceae bacterium]|nr:hypothetical protein [Rhodospirillaceae bacterium]HAA93357.1 hypothetical protein [Rhodospirillaceae bacterium]
MSCLLGFALPSAADESFVNSYRCEGGVGVLETAGANKDLLQIAESGDGFSLNLQTQVNSYSGFGVARHNENAQITISFALTDAKGEGTIAGVLQRAKDPQGRLIAGAIKIVYSAMRNYKDYDTEPVRMMCQAPAGR